MVVIYAHETAQIVWPAFVEMLAAAFSDIEGITYTAGPESPQPQECEEHLPHAAAHHSEPSLPVSHASYICHPSSVPPMGHHVPKVLIINAKKIDADPDYDGDTILAASPGLKAVVIPHAGAYGLLFVPLP